MKIHSILTATVFCLISAHAYAEEAAKKPLVLVKRPTHAQLVKKQDQQKLERHKHRVRPLTEKPLVTIKSRSLIDNSTLLAHGSHWTLVPKRSVIHIPARLKDKVVSKPVGTLISWSKFLRKNAGWLHVHPVKMTQAQGKAKIDQQVIKAYKTMGKIVVATCHRGPISVAPDSLKPPLTEEEKLKLLKEKKNQKEAGNHKLSPPKL